MTPAPSRRIALRRLVRLAVIACGGVAALAYAAIMAGLLYIAWLHWDEPNGLLPPELGVRKVLASGSQIGGPREGCGHYVYQLDDATTARLRTEGTAWLGARPDPPKNNPDNPFGPWHSAPIGASQSMPKTYEGTTLHALGGESCQGRKGRGVPSVKVLMRDPSSIWSVTENGEDMIIVSPRYGTAVYTYFG